jgi:DNA-binding transcriptional MerR regulator
MVKHVSGKIKLYSFEDKKELLFITCHQETGWSHLQCRANPD